MDKSESKFPLLLSMKRTLEVIAVFKKVSQLSVQPNPIKGASLPAVQFNLPMKTRQFLVG